MKTESSNVVNSRLWREQPALPRDVHVEGSCFEWIEKTDGPKFDEIRQRIESLWLRMPKGKRPEYSARLRSKRRTDFFSAYNELWYHQALEAGGLRCSPSETTPSGSLPDLLLAGDQGPVAIAECYLRMEPQKTARDDFVQNRWFHATRRQMKDKRVRLWIHGIVCGHGSPSARRLAKKLDELAEQSPVEEDQGSIHKHGRFQYEDAKSGWALDFTLMIRVVPVSDAVAQLLYMQSPVATWCQGAELFEEAISRKSRQHPCATLPTVICVGWNHCEHEPDFDEVIRVAAEKSASLSKRGAHGIFWAREVYPWNAAPAAPRLLHWGSPEIAPLLGVWRGSVIDVNESVGL